jgi:hypothetical protein
MSVVLAMAGLEWRRLWLLPSFALAASIVAVALAGPDRFWPGLIAWGAGLVAACSIGARLHGATTRFVFARGVSTSAVVGGALLAAFSLGLAIFGAALAPLAFADERVLDPGFAYTLVMFLALPMAWGTLGGVLLCGLANGSRIAAVVVTAVTALLFALFRIDLLDEWLRALPVWSFDQPRWVAYAIVLVSMSVPLAVVAAGVARGRGRLEPALGATARALAVGTGIVVLASAGWIADVRAAGPNDYVRLLMARPAPESGWAVVSGHVRRGTLYTPTFLVHPASGRHHRVEHVSWGAPTAFSADGRVFAALDLRGPRAARARLMTMALEPDGRVGWHASSRIRLDDPRARLALSPSGTLVAVRTPQSLTILDTRTLSQVAHLVHAHHPFGVLAFKGESAVVTERAAVPDGTGASVEVVSIDAATRAVRAVGRYGLRAPHAPMGTTLDQGGRFLVVWHLDSAAPQRLERLDLETGESVVLAEPARRLRPGIVLPDGRVVATRSSGAGDLRIEVLGGRTALSVPLPFASAARLQWLGGELVAVAPVHRHDAPVEDDTTFVVDLASGTIVHRETGILPAWGSEAVPSVLFVQGRREVVVRPDLAQ